MEGELQIERPRSRALVVEADRLAAAALASILRAEGHEVVVEYDARSAVRQLVRFRPDLVVVDMHLLGDDGTDLLERVRLVPGAGGSSVVVLAGAHDQAELYRELGADVVLSGSIDRASLRDAIAAVADIRCASHGDSPHLAALEMLRQLGARAESAMTPAD